MAAAGDVESQFNIGVHEEQSGAYAAAVEWYAKAAATGHPAAQDRLGFLYATGQGVSQDHAVALEWFQKSAAQNHPAGMSNLGLMYLRGRGVPQDERKALELFTRAGQLGDAAAQARLGGYFERGELVQKNHAEAYNWYRKAAEQGNVQGQNGFAWIMAVSEVDALRNGSAAVHYATLVNKRTGWQGTQYLATLAAAYAEAGDFDEAVRWQTKVVEAIASLSAGASAEMESRLRLYRNGRPFRAK